MTQKPNVSSCSASTSSRLCLCPPPPHEHVVLMQKTNLYKLVIILFVSIQGLNVEVKGHWAQGCDCAANWLILANSNPNFGIFEIGVNQVRKCFLAWWVVVFTIQEPSCKCYNCRRFLRILANFASGQSHPCWLVGYVRFYGLDG